MDESELAAELQRHGVDTSSLSLVLSRREESIYELDVRHENALALWRTLRDLVPVIGYWPVIGWGRRWLDDVPEYRSRVESGSTAEILAESEEVDLARWKQAQIDEFLESAREDAAAYELEPPTDYFEEVQGEWPEEAAPYTRFSIPKPVEHRDPITPLPVALVPTCEGWQVPAYLRFDAGAISPAVHTSVARLWSEQYSAEIVGVLPDLMEMEVGRPPTTREEALALAKEQYIYSADIVIQGTQTVQALAAGLLDGTAWFFWWD